MPFTTLLSGPPISLLRLTSRVVLNHNKNGRSTALTAVASNLRHRHQHRLCKSAASQQDICGTISGHNPTLPHLPPTPLHISTPYHIPISRGFSSQPTPDMEMSTNLSADSSQAPFAAQDPEEVGVLVRAMDRKRNKTQMKKPPKKKGFNTKISTYKVDGSPDGSVVTSWRFLDTDYKKRDLPIHARGLFTTTTRDGKHEIVIRGYDKFFNIGEVPETRWANIQTQTKGPYELSLKENGCIIFISGLEDETLLVCSKHSTGRRNDVSLSHSQVGEKWIDKHLATVGKTRRDLARELRKRNATAVAELCDDEFEEHILAYGPDKAGLYLHGININVPKFMTYPSNQVHQFANEWGFKMVDVKMMDDVDTVKQFLDDVARTGAHEGRDIEGFVVRCKMSPDPGQAPYHDWFFKYKFDEPYLMYRQWRECTKALIANEPPKVRKHVKITQEYLMYARWRLAEDPELGKRYMMNHGIIQLRDDFLARKNLKGSDAANIEGDASGEDSGTEVTSKVVLVPIATIGCGKTTIAVALCHLFGWGHIQNDNIQGNRRPQQMAEKVRKHLEKHAVVIADRNNSERRERERIMSDLRLKTPTVRLVAMHFVHEDYDEIRRITRERVTKRGDKHQTIQAATDERHVLEIMENFMTRFEPCQPDLPPDSRFDLIVNLDPTQSSRVNLEKLVKELHEAYPRLVEPMPSPQAMDEAIRVAIEDYIPPPRLTKAERKGKGKGKGVEANATPNKQPNATQEQPSKAANLKQTPLEYMSVKVPADMVKNALEAAFKDTDEQTSRFHKLLQQTGRVQKEFHVTLMHKASAKENPQQWDKYVGMAAEAGPDGKVAECEVEFERVVYDHRIMAIVARLLDPKWTSINRVAHITVGTADPSIKPKESNDLLARWLEVGSGGETGISERVMEPRVIAKGTVSAVLSRR